MRARKAESNEDGATKVTKGRGRARKNANGEGSVYFDRSKNLWYANVPTGHDETTGKTIFRKSKGYKTRAEAEKARRDALLALDQGIGRGTTIPTVGAYLDQWLTIIQRSHLEPKTKESYAYVVALTKPLIGTTPLDKLTADHVDRFFAALQTKGGLRGQGVSPKTAQIVRAALHLAFERAVKKKLIGTNVIALSDAIPSKRKDVQPFTEDEVNILLDTVTGERLEALYYVAVYLGLREGELLGLRWADVDLSGGLLRVRQQVQQPQTGAPFIKELKTKNARRDLDLPAELVTVLRAHHDRQRIESRDKEGWNPHGLVFPSTAGTPIRARNLIESYKKLLKRASLPDRTIHDLRHTAATIMFDRGLALLEVSRILGHASVAVTEQVYVHWIPAKAGRLSSAMTGLRRAAQG
jgi:integrase